MEKDALGFPMFFNNDDDDNVIDQAFVRRIQIKKQNSEVKVMYMLRVLKACYPVGGERNGCFARSKSVLHE